MHSDLLPGKHLLFDHHTVADTFRLRRRVHQPRRGTDELVLKPEKPWEGRFASPTDIKYNAERGVYRMWYTVFRPDLDAERFTLKGAILGRVGEPQSLYMCYAESRDGCHWDRPALDIYPDAAGPNNICFKGFSRGGVANVVDRPEAPPDERYVGMGLDWFSLELGGMIVAYSPDGLHWRYPENRPVIFGHSDTVNSLVYNPERQVYMVYMRGWHTAAVNWPALNKPHPRRRVAYAESSDLKNWSESHIILTPDELDPNDFYALQVFRYADYYLGQLWIHNEEGDDTIEIELVWSRDGFTWSRLPERPRFIPHGETGRPDSHMILPCHEPVAVGDDLWVYYTGVNCPHSDTSYGTYSPVRGKLRMDGFLSLDAGPQSGALITRPFTLQNDTISINAMTTGGEIIVEITEPWFRETHGKPVEGFAAKDFDVFKGDRLVHQLSWNGSSNLRSLKGKRLMLRIWMRHAQFYSFTI